MKILFALLLVAVVPAFAAAPNPQLSVKTLDGSTFDLSAHKGKWVIVN